MLPGHAGVINGRSVQLRITHSYWSGIDPAQQLSIGMRLAAVWPVSIYAGASTSCMHSVSHCSVTHESPLTVPLLPSQQWVNY